MKGNLLLIILSVLIASILPDILLDHFTELQTDRLIYIKILIFAVACILSLLIKKIRPLFKFFLLLTVISAANIVTSAIYATDLWKSNLVSSSFVGTYGSSVLLKLIGIIPIFIILLLVFKNPKKFYFSIGDLSVKSDKIVWLGIKEGAITWGKLSFLSAFLIGLGTALLVIITVTKNISVDDVGNWVKYIPLILLLALCNSFCEGLIYRNAMLGVLKDNLPKSLAVLVAAIFFGIGHYYGAPGGVLGMFMSGLLGWYMCRSMYETNGFAAAWFIHFVQDSVIFSTILLTGY